MSVRLARKSDIVALTSLREQMAEYFRRGALPAEEIAFIDNYYRNTWDEKSPIILAYENEEGKVLGMAAIAILRGQPSLKWNKFCRLGFVLDVSVDRSSRGAGVGTKLIREIMRVAKQKEVSLLLLTATDMGQGLYEKFGFSAVHQGEILLEAVWTTYEKIAAEFKPSVEGLIVRKASKRKEDIEAMVALRGQLVRSARKVEVVPPEEVEFVRNFYTHEWDGSNPTLLVAEEVKEGRIVAMAGVAVTNGMPSMPYNPTCHLGIAQDVVVDEAMRGRGLGTLIFGSLMKHCREDRVGYLILTATQDAVALYKKFGFYFEDKSVGMEATWDRYSPLV